MDGPFSFTAVIENPDGSIVVRREYILVGSYVTFTDLNGDGKVDRVLPSPNPFARNYSSGTYNREKHFAKYPDVFEKADRDFREQIARFKPYLRR